MRAALLLIVAAAIAGCGYKSSLFLPEDKAEPGRRGVGRGVDPAPQRPVPSEAVPPVPQGAPSR